MSNNVIDWIDLKYDWENKNEKETTVIMDFVLPQENSKENLENSLS